MTVSNRIASSNHKNNRWRKASAPEGRASTAAGWTHDRLTQPLRDVPQGRGFVYIMSRPLRDVPPGRGSGTHMGIPPA